MRQFSAAVLSRALGAVKALLAPSRGRHSAAALRRRRSARVRRYAPLPDVPALLRPVPERPEHPARPVPPAHPGPAVPRPLPVEDTALVRPYYETHERELALVQARAADRLRQWTRSRPAAARTGGPVVGLLPGTPGPATRRLPAARCEYRGVPA